jgi:hypothetical protein
MTSLNSKATSSEIKKIKNDELERLIAVLRATGQDERAEELEEIKSTIDDLIEDLYSLVDTKSENIIGKLFSSRISKLNEPSE